MAWGLIPQPEEDNARQDPEMVTGNAQMSGQALSSVVRLWIPPPEGSIWCLFPCESAYAMWR